jgi:hypothetical protein
VFFNFIYLFIYLFFREILSFYLLFLIFKGERKIRDSFKPPKKQQGKQIEAIFDKPFFSIDHEKTFGFGVFAILKKEFKEKNE